jgi:hypothetical protein
MHTTSPVQLSQDPWCYGTEWVRFKSLLISCPLPINHFLKTGDSYASAGMLEFVSMIKDVHPGIFVHSIYIEEDLSADKRAGFVCTLLS